MIEVLNNRIAAGERIKNWFCAYLTDHTRYGVKVLLQNRRQVVHDVFPKDHDEYGRWCKETEEWWNSPINPRKQPRRRRCQD